MHSNQLDREKGIPTFAGGLVPGVLCCIPGWPAGQVTLSVGFCCPRLLCSLSLALGFGSDIGLCIFFFTPGLSLFQPALLVPAPAVGKAWFISSTHTVPLTLSRMVLVIVQSSW